MYGIVQQSRGFVAVRSAPTEGTTFDIYLPAEAEEPVAAAACPRASPPLRAGHADETILVVEDEDQVRAALQRQLSAEGYSVLTAADGQAASAVRHLEMRKARSAPVPRLGDRHDRRALVHPLASFTES